MELISLMFLVLVILTLWLNVLATVSLIRDDTLEPSQRNSQLIIVWLIPFIGAVIILRLVFEHSPNAIPKRWVPWPFKGLVYGKSDKTNKNRDENESDYCHYSSLNRTHSADMGGDGGD